jgi:hypothetical protein
MSKFATFATSVVLVIAWAGAVGLVTVLFATI